MMEKRKKRTSLRGYNTCECWKAWKSELSGTVVRRCIWEGRKEGREGHDNSIGTARALGGGGARVEEGCERPTCTRATQES